MKTCTLFFAALLVAGTQAFAQIASVEDAKKMRDDQKVTLEGIILRAVAGEDDDFVFQDHTGSITVEIDGDVRGANSVSPGMRVRISGEVDKEFFGRKIEVERFEALAPPSEMTLSAMTLQALEPGQPSLAQAIKPLPPPDKQGGKPLQEALLLRKSDRQYSDREVSMETLSSLLWAGFGISRPDGKRTAPTASNMQDIEIYVVKKDGAYRYDARGNALLLVTPNDLSSLTASQDFAKRAPVNLLYVQTLKGENPDSRADLVGGLHVGAISQNVGLFCASENLANVVRLSLDTKALAQALSLPADQRILLAHSIGYAP